MEQNKYSGEYPFYPHQFDFNSFEFYNGDDSYWKNQEYKKQFLMANGNDINKKAVFQQMIQLVYLQATKKLNEEQNLP